MLISSQHHHPQSSGCMWDAPCSRRHQEFSGAMEGIRPQNLIQIQGSKTIQNGFEGLKLSLHPENPKPCLYRHLEQHPGSKGMTPLLQQY